MSRLMEIVKKLIAGEIIKYVIAGAMTTAISLITFELCLRVFAHLPQNPALLLANTVSTVLAVLFAFFINKAWVFNSGDFSAKTTLKELTAFGLGRLFTFGVDTCLLFLLVNVFLWEPMVSKLINQFTIIVLNYIISKTLIFKGNKKRGD